jgi:hypothetical protein
MNVSWRRPAHHRDNYPTLHKGSAQQMTNEWLDTCAQYPDRFRSYRRTIVHVYHCLAFCFPVRIASVDVVAFPGREQQHELPRWGMMFRNLKPPISFGFESEKATSIIDQETDHSNRL